MTNLERDTALAAIANAVSGLALGERRIVAAVRHLASPLGYPSGTQAAIDHLNRGIEEIEVAERSIIAAMRCMDAGAKDDDGGPDRMTNEGGPPSSDAEERRKEHRV